MPPKRQKRLYSKPVRLARVAFAEQIPRMSNNDLREKLSMAMDGVVLALPPTDPTERMNFCRHGENHMWRKSCESFRPKLSGDKEYGNQVPLERAAPMWGGCSADGFSVITFHAKKKLNAEEWAKAVTRGALATAIQALKPVLVNGPWHVLCDNESFLRAAVSSAAHRTAKVMLWKMPAKSPDPNPVERFWFWLRGKLRAMDLQDSVAKRPVFGNAAYKARVRAVCRSQQAQRVAANQAKLMKRVCRRVVLKKGAATGF